MHGWDCDGSGDNCSYCTDKRKVDTGWQPPNWWPDGAREDEQQRLESVRHDLYGPKRN